MKKRSTSVKQVIDKLIFEEYKTRTR